MDVLKNASDEQQKRAIVENYWNAWTSSIRPEFGFDDPYELFGIRGFISAIPFAMMNSLFDGHDNITKAEIAKIQEYYNERNLTLMWYISPFGENQNLVKLLSNTDFKYTEYRVPGMLVDIHSIDLSNYEKMAVRYEIQSIFTPSEPLTKIVELLVEVFQVDRSLLDQFQQLFRGFLSHPNSTMYYIQQDGLPIATATVFYDAGVAGVYHVATKSMYAGKGLASSLMAKLLLDAYNHGFQYSIVHSTPSGKPLYNKLGYEEKFTFQRFTLNL